MTTSPPNSPVVRVRRLMMPNNITFLLLLLWQLLLIIAQGSEHTACIDNLLNGADSRVGPDDHLLGTLANQSLTVAWDNKPLTNLTLAYNSVGTLSISGSVPTGAAMVYSRRSESFRHAGSTTVVQSSAQVAPVAWTFDRVGTFAVSVYLVPDYETNRDNAKCLFYADDMVTYTVKPTDDMIDIAVQRNAYAECNLCPENETLAVSEMAVFVPPTGVEQTCAGWFQNGINGQLNVELCAVLQDIEGNGGCSCEMKSAAAEQVVLSRLAVTATTLTLTIMLASSWSASGL
jgi:hypothetical protein